MSQSIKDNCRQAAMAFAGLAVLEVEPAKKNHFASLAEAFNKLADQWPRDAPGILTNNGTGSLSWE